MKKQLTLFLLILSSLLPRLVCAFQVAPVLHNNSPTLKCRNNLNVDISKKSPSIFKEKDCLPMMKNSIHSSGGDPIKIRPNFRFIQTTMKVILTITVGCTLTAVDPATALDSATIDISSLPSVSSATFATLALSFEQSKLLFAVILHWILWEFSPKPVAFLFDMGCIADVLYESTMKMSAWGFSLFARYHYTRSIYHMIQSRTCTENSSRV